MKRVPPLLVLCALAMLAPQAVWAGDPLQLQKSVRTLEALQDAVAAGDVEARRLQGQLITQIEADIRNTSDETLKLPQNLEALATVLLSGANPTIVEAHTMSLAMDENTKNLLQGALAFARADREGALRYFKEVKTDELPPSLAGRVALVRSIIGAGDDPARAIDDLYTARQLMPGTSIEEASLRRCVAFTAKIDDMERLGVCASRYMRRFARSLYWPEFESNFAMGVGLTGYGKGKQLAEILSSAEVLGDEKKRGLLLSLARSALTHGRLELAISIADAAAEACFAESPEMARAKLYRAAALVAGGSYEEGQKLLGELQTGKLEKRDIALYTQAKNLTEQIGSEPVLTTDEAKRTLSVTVNPTADPELDKALMSASQALAQSEKVLEPAKP